MIKNAKQRNRPSRAKPGAIEGRPTLYRPEYCKLVLEDMAKGFSLTAFAGLVGVDRKTISDWMDVHPEFYLACTRGKALQLRKWEVDAHRVAKDGGGGGAATMVIFGLKNMGGDEWREKQDQPASTPNELVIRVEGGFAKPKIGSDTE
jgi:hypothetical protein